jgi:hypothetical protein
MDGAPRAAAPLPVAILLTPKRALKRLRSRAGLRVAITHTLAGNVTVKAKGRLLGRGLVRAGHAIVRPTLRARRVRGRTRVTVTAAVRTADGRVLRLTRRVTLR